MTLKEFRTEHRNSLSSIYENTEIDSFFFLMIEEYLQLKRIDYSLHPDAEIKPSKLSMLNSTLERLKKEEPIQYIFGKTEFYGYPFFVDKNTLIPRPETEELVTWVLSEIKNLQLSTNKKSAILDIGTGTGCIPISLAKESENNKFTAIDFSKKTLEVAKKNAILNNVHITFLEADILKTEKLSNSFDIIVSNPPYVRDLEKKEIRNNVLQNEPHKALFVPDENPLLFYDKIADLAKNHLTKNGFLFFEINQYLSAETVNLLKSKGFKNLELKKDFFGNYRMIKASL